MAEKLYRLSKEEIEINLAAADNPNLWFQYWLEKPGIDPFQLDRNFTEDSKWQEDFCMAAQHMIVAICGIATGKTLACGMSAFYHAVCTPYFRFMNIGHELMQAKFMYDEILRFTSGTRAEKLIFKAPSAPHPKIEIKYMVGDIKIESELLFQSAGEKSDAMNIFSWRGDWINIEEAGRFNNLQEIVSRLTTRLTGTTPTGRPYIGRMSLISNPIDNPELWVIFDKARANDDALTFMIDTKDNKNVTEEQIRLQMDNIPEEEQDFYLSGKRPDGKGAYFSRETVEKCASELMTMQLREGLAKKVTADAGNGYSVVTSLTGDGTSHAVQDHYVGHYYPALGYWHYEFPWKNDHQYMVLGDPGTGAAPLRNAPTLLVADVTNAPRLNKIIALWWGNGGGKIAPFVSNLFYFVEKYKPVFVGIDSTATQKNFAEVLNTQYFLEDHHYSVEKIHGMDFSGGNKYRFLVSLRLTLEMGAWTWPDKAKGISSQLKSYDDLEDRNQSSKLAQDIVATLAMASFASRALYPPEPPKKDGEEQGESDKRTGGNRRNREAGHRSIRSATSR